MKWMIGILAAVCVLSAGWTAISMMGVASSRQQHFKDAEKAVANLTRDPDAAKFRSLAYFEKNGTVCGQINSKNVYGAYNGYTDFLYSPTTGVAFEGLAPSFGQRFADCQVLGKK